MKIHLFFEIIISFLLILLPLSSNSKELFVIQPFSLYTLILYFILSSIIYFRYKRLLILSNTEQPSSKKSFIYTFCLLLALLINAFFWNFIAIKFNINSTIELGFNKFNFFILFNLFIGTILAATYEEFLYRFYVPKVAEHISIFFNDRYGKKIANITLVVLELIIIILFALGHSYIGIISVLNAFCAGIMLRLFTKKISVPIYVISAHSFFNLIQYFLLIRK